MSQRIGAVVALLVGTIAAAGLGETVLRVVYRHDYVWPSHRNWRLRKVWHERFAPLNAFGFRDREHSSTKPEGVFRIVAIGDSLTYGVGIESPNDRYTAVLEQRLNRSGPRRVEVLNCAIPAWNVLEYAKAVKTRVPPFDPDLILIGFFPNDIELDRSRRPEPLQLLPLKAHSILIRASYFYTFVYSRLDSIASKEDYLRYRLARADSSSLDWRAFEPRWRSLLRASKLLAGKVVVGILPHLSDLDDEHPFLELYQRVEDLSGAEGADVVQLFPSVKGEQPKDLWIGFSDSHPNERAHRLFGESLAVYLEAQLE